MPAGEFGSATSTAVDACAIVTAVGGDEGTRTEGAPAAENPIVTANAPTGPVEIDWKPLTETGGGPSGTNVPLSSIRSGDRSAQSQDTSTSSTAFDTTGPEAGNGFGMAKCTEFRPGFCTGSAATEWFVSRHDNYQPHR